MIENLLTKLPPGARQPILSEILDRLRSSSRNTQDEPASSLAGSSTTPTETSTATGPAAQLTPMYFLDCQNAPRGSFSLTSSDPSCRSYLRCSGGRGHYRMSCPPGLVFDVTNNYCNWPMEAVCPLTQN